MTEINYKTDVELIINKLKESLYDMFGSDVRWTARCCISSESDNQYYAINYIPDKSPYQEHYLRYSVKTDPYIIHEVYDIDDNLVRSEQLKEISSD
jgi:hypothetical protein